MPSVLAFMLLVHRNDHRRQLLRMPRNFATRVRLARVMRDINDRVGHYLFALAVIYSGVAAISAAVLALLGLPNAMIWGVADGPGLLHSVRRRAGRDRPGGVAAAF